MHLIINPTERGKQMMKITLLTILAIVAFQQRSAAQAPIKLINPDTLVRRLGQQHITQAGAGLSVGLYYNGKNYTYNFGSVEKGKSLLPTANTLYELGSITKTFMGYLLAKAVIDKKAGMDDDVRTYLDGKYPNLEYQGHPVTLKELANTTSGIPDGLPPLPAAVAALSGDSLLFASQAFENRVTRKDFFEALHQVKLDTIPGYKARHSNAGSQLLAYALEKIYHTPYEKLVSRYIFRPLHMEHTLFMAARSGSPMLAKGYNKSGTQMPYFNATALSGHAGVSSCSADMLKYLRFQLDSKDHAVKLSHEKTLIVDVYGIALNWFVYRYDDGYSQVWTDGSTLGFYDFIIFYPELDLGIILLGNKADAQSYSRLAAFADQIFNAVKPQK
jgi:D-alanyl-D-alanine-carboxypeptidase/D-alanyl-D-alanine-endopeptidase